MNVYKVLFIVLISHGALHSQNLNDELKTSSISIFRNQTAFVIKDGQVDTKNGIYRIEEGIPGALYGTLWFDTPKKNIKSIISFPDTVSNVLTNKAKTFQELLASNLNKKVKLFLRDDVLYEGIVDELNGHLLTIKTDSSYVNFETSNIKRLEFLAKPDNEVSIDKTRVQHVLEVNFRDKAANQQLNMMYLQGGYSWHPHYLIELDSETKAHLTLSADLVNDVEDISDAEINFVVGVPNFKYADKGATLVDFVPIIKPAVKMTYKVEWSPDTYEEKVVAVPQSGADNSVAGSIQEDLFFYTLKDVNLKKGGRGHYELLSSDIDIQHIYECNLSGNSSANKNYTEQYLFTPSADTKVIHTLRLDNNGTMPWTTGSALVVKKTKGGKKPISQDKLNYTSVKDHSYLKLTEAPDIQVTHQEKQILREEKFKKAPRHGSKYFYDLITVEATIKVKSYKQKSVAINIKRPLLGQLLETSVPWLKSERVREHNPLNKTTDVCWETNIGGGEELEITYQYKLFVNGW